MEEFTIKSISKISNAKHFTLKDELSIFSEIQNEIERYKSLNQISANTLISNYEKWISSKLKRKLVAEVFK